MRVNDFRVDNNPRKVVVNVNEELPGVVIGVDFSGILDLQNGLRVPVHNVHLNCVSVCGR